MRASGGHTDCQEVLYRTVFRRNPPDKTRWPAYKSAFRLPPVSQSRIDDVVAGALTWTEVDLVNIGIRLPGHCGMRWRSSGSGCITTRSDNPATSSLR